MNRNDGAKKLHGLLELQRRAVGVKLVSGSEYGDYEARTLVRPMHYCIGVKCAMAGHSIKLDRRTSGCFGSSRALGLVEPAEDFYSGERGAAMGLYRNAEVAAGVARAFPITPPDTYGVIIKPLEFFESDPDVVLIAAESRTIMRILQGYTHIYGLPTGMHMSGNQAVCVESTVTPMNTGSINVSMMCSGTRYQARWRDNESMIGIPFDRFYGTLEGIEGTVNAVEPDERKKQIKESLLGSGLLEIEIEYGKTYYA